MLVTRCITNMCVQQGGVVPTLPSGAARVTRAGAACSARPDARRRPPARAMCSYRFGTSNSKHTVIHRKMEPAGPLLLQEGAAAPAARTQAPSANEGTSDPFEPVSPALAAAAADLGGGAASSVLKLKGLPYSVAEKDIRDFFKGYAVRGGPGTAPGELRPPTTRARRHAHKRARAHAPRRRRSSRRSPLCTSPTGGRAGSRSQSLRRGTRRCRRAAGGGRWAGDGHGGPLARGALPHPYLPTSLSLSATPLSARRPCR